MDDEKLMRMIKVYDELHFCLLIVLYYQKNNNHITNMDQLISKNPETILVNLPPEIVKFLKIYDFENKIKLMEESKFKEFLAQENDYLIQNIKSVFSLWKILLRQFAELSAKDPKLLEEVFSILKLICIGDLKNLLYVGENFNEYSLSELLFILVQLKNYQEIHIINYDESLIDIQKCLENVRNDLFDDEEAINSMMERVIIKQDAQLSFEYLDTYIKQNLNEKFIIIIGMERFIEFKDNNDITIKLADSVINLNTSEHVDWTRLLDKINKVHSLVRESSTFVFTVYVIDNPLDDALRKIKLHNNGNVGFNILLDETHSTYYGSDKEKKLYAEILNRIFNDDRPLERISECEKILSKVNFITLKAHYYLRQNDFYHAILELEQLPDDADCYSKMLLAQLYNMIGETKAAYAILKEIYKKDRYFPNLINSILYALKDSDNNEEYLSWIKKGFALNSNDPVMVQHLGNYYTIQEEYMSSAEEWKRLYELTKDPFYTLLYEINIILSWLDKKQLKNISVWVNEKISMYPQYADEIYSRIGSIIYDKINKEKALPYFEEVKESFDETYYNIAGKKMKIYYDKYFRKTERNINQNERNDFILKLAEHVLILTYSEQSVYSWSMYIQKSFSYDEWEALSSQMLVECLLKLAKSYLNGEAGESKLCVNEKSYENLDLFFKKNDGSMIPDLDMLNYDEYLLVMLAQGKTKIIDGEIQTANDIAYTFFRSAWSFEDSYHKNISMCFGLLIWSGASMAIGAYAEGIVSFLAAANRLSEIGESEVLHDFELVFDQFLYLYLVSPKIELNSENISLLKNYFEQRRYPETILYYISGMYDKVIKQNPPRLKKLVNQMEEANIIILAKNETLESILFFDSIILSYYKTSELDTARKYLCRLYPSIELTLANHIHIVHHFLLRYSNILIDICDYSSAIKLFKSSLSSIEKLRGLSFSSERSYLGASVEMVYRRIIYILCEKSSTQNEELKLEGLLSHIIINLVPKSIIEEKNGNSKAVSDQELLSREKQYYQLFNILTNIPQKTLDNLAYKRIANQFLETKSYLEQNHPRFKALKSYSLIGCKNMDPFIFLRSKLVEGELFYRNILIESYLVHILVNKDDYYIYYDKINTDKLCELLKHLDSLIDDNVYDLEKSEFDKYIHLFEDLTSMLFQPLIAQIDLADALYYMPDHKLRHITPNFLRINDKWGIQCFSKIELVIDYNNIGNSKRGADNFPNKYFISESTKGGLQIIKKTLNDFPAFSKIDLKKDEYILIQEPINTLIVAAHGISEVFGESYYGAKKLELSRKKQIDLNEFIVLNSSFIENAIIIACSGGTPTNNKIERNNGVWDSMLKKNVKYILYCKWDVSTKHTNDLLAIILQEIQKKDKLLSEALNIAQRKLMNLNPILWAGLEVWKNH